MRFLTLAIFFPSMLACALPYAESVTFSPALSESGATGIQPRIEVPLDTPDGFHRYRCDATITPDGEARDVDCYGPRTAATDPLLRSITRAVKEARYQPARSEGRPVKVFMTLSMLVKVEAKQALVGVFPNDGEHWTTLGTNYVSPQRFSGGYGSMSYSNAIQENNRASATLRVRVDTTGRVTTLSVEEQSGSFQRKELDALKKRVRAMAFLPGLHKGRPVEMDYLLLYNRRQHAQPDFRPMYGSGAPSS